nr:type I restriction enzyme HsdR N-terminal domain-containing protein [uncultured Methanoregula sp.]
MREFHERELVNILIETLKHQGVSEDSIALEWPIESNGHHYRVDLAIIDKLLNKPIALFEIKSRKDRKREKDAEFQLKRYASLLKNQDIPLFVVYPNESKDTPLEITRIKQDPDDADSYDFFSSDQIPKISILKNSARQKTLFELLNEKENAIKNFQLVCWILGFGSLVILILNLTGFLVLKTEQIALIGVVLGLFLLPFASKIKIPGLEFERLKDAEQ